MSKLSKWTYGLLLQVILAGNLLGPAQADIVLLYDGVGSPSGQAWLNYANNSILNGGTATESVQSGGVRLQSDLAVSGGYSNRLPTGQLKNALFPSLNRANGFELAFTLAVAAENHTSNDRAGFSVTLLGSDARGIELGFWGDQVWAQSSNPLFTHGEGLLFDTTPSRDYRLQIQNNTYTLFAGSNSILTGAVRDYTAFNALPYTLPNFLFLGDNTSSAAATVTLGTISLQSNLSAVPEPSSFSLLALFGLSVYLIQYSNVVSPWRSPYNLTVSWLHAASRNLRASFTRGVR